MSLLTWWRFKVRWWRWFLLDNPNTYQLIKHGADRESRRIAYRRWEEREPKP